MTASFVLKIVSLEYYDVGLRIYYIMVVSFRICVKYITTPLSEFLKSHFPLSCYNDIHFFTSFDKTDT